MIVMQLFFSEVGGLGSGEEPGSKPIVSTTVEKKNAEVQLLSKATQDEVRRSTDTVLRRYVPLN
jgi:hypothetical protein